jgi:beta-ribofuranosylaminobenzene 5'-phosphate synthase
VEGLGIEVTVRTPSRLHFSMIDLRGDLGRIHGSVGVAIDRPNIVLRARAAPEVRVGGPRAERMRAFAEAILDGSGVKGGAELELVSDIREHSGFGSGTQLGLAVGTALSELYGLRLSTEEIALKLDRSMRSGIGTYAFKHGGFIVDGGRRVDRKNGIPPLLFRSDIPEDWLFVIGLPSIAQDHSGAAEDDAFRRLEPPPEELMGEISRLILMQMIPAILEEDIAAFGGAMTGVDFKFGEFWEDVQGGRFSHPDIEAGVNFLLEEGAYGVGQSSWGPAFYGLVEGEGQAREVTGKLERFLNSGGRRGEAFYVRPDNKGAIVTIKEG